MLDFSLSIDQYKEMISKEEFEMKEYQSEFYHEFEQIGSYGKDMAIMFEQLAERIGRVPSQTEYIKEGYRRAKKFFNDPKKVKDGGRWFFMGENEYGEKEFALIKWEDKLKKAIKSRLARGYTSHLVEYSTILTLRELFPDYHVGANDYLDLVAGIDIVVGSKSLDKMLYIHITSDSGYSDYWLGRKEKKKGRGYDGWGNLHYFTRSFKKGHLQLAFTYDDSASTMVINGVPMLREEHISNVIEIAFKNAPNLDSFRKKEQLKRLHDWLKDKGINKNGLGKFWIK